MCFRLVCETGPTSNVLTNKVEVKVSGNGVGYSKEAFSYVVSTFQNQGIDFLKEQFPEIQSNM